MSASSRATRSSFRRAVRVVVCASIFLGGSAVPRATAPPRIARGGQLIVAERSAPRTFNPVVVIDSFSRTIQERLFADLVHINRHTFRTEPSLAASWTVTPDGRTYTMKLRPGLKFSDGHPFTADDVVFTFDVYLDEKIHAPQRDLLIVGGKPIEVRKKDDTTVTVTLAEPYAVADRMFDGIAILPKHLLADARAAGTIGRAWGLDAPPSSIAGLGPFRLKEYVPGERVVLERNPYYWKRDSHGTALPYLDRVVFEVVPNPDTEFLRFQAGGLDVMSRMTADQFGSLAAAKPTPQAVNAGAGFEYNFLFFNLNDVANPSPEVTRKLGWFRQDAFRQAISAAIDRQALVSLVYRGLAEPLWGPVTRGNRAWRNDGLPRPARSLDRARALLRGAGFTWREDGALLDGAHTPVAFSVMVQAGSAPRRQMATVIQNDLAQIGIGLSIAPLDSGALQNRVFESRDYDACILGIVSGDADPNTDMNVWLSSGSQHFWRPAGATAATPWEAEIDSLMRQQVAARAVPERKKMFDRVQALLAEHQPMIFLASPDILVAAKATLGNFTPAILPHYALWNVDELYWRPASGG
jgi:peptide/nickel transport system substrate-binding protein